MIIFYIEFSFFHPYLLINVRTLPTGKTSFSFIPFNCNISFSIRIGTIVLSTNRIYSFSFLDGMLKSFSIWIYFYSLFLWCCWAFVDLVAGLVTGLVAGLFAGLVAGLVAGFGLGVSKTLS